VANQHRDSSAKVSFIIVSEASFANRHSVDIFWSKAQEPPQPTTVSEIEIIADPYHFTFTMNGVATPDSKQSEAYIATAALYYTFSGNAKEEKVGIRLPPVWRDLWSNLAEARKNQIDSQDRAVVKDLRALVRERHDQELEDGVILQGAFRGRGAGRNQLESGDDGSQDRARQTGGNAEYYQKIWFDKSNTPKYQKMLARLSRSFYK
jgi:ATP-dependent RNA helicase DHX29